MELEEFLAKLDLTTLRENLKNIDSDYSDFDDNDVEDENHQVLAATVEEPFKIQQSLTKVPEESPTSKKGRRY
jgi:hypothetical protein